MNPRIWSIISMLLILSLALAATSCQSSTAKPTLTVEEGAKTGEPYKIGAVLMIIVGLIFVIKAIRY